MQFFLLFVDEEIHLYNRPLDSLTYHSLARFPNVTLTELSRFATFSWFDIYISVYNTLFSICFRVQQVHEKWVNIRTLLQTKLINILNIHTNPDFKFLAECTEWVAQKLVS